jgi:hypothetical protein
MANEHLRVPTEKLLVRILTANLEIEGYAHIRTGGYRSRLVDLLNSAHINFIPITEAKYRVRTEEPTEFIDSDWVIVSLDDIELVDIMEKPHSV